MPDRPTTYAKVFPVPNGTFLREPFDAEKLLRIPLAEPILSTAVISGFKHRWWLKDRAVAQPLQHAQQQRLLVTFPIDGLLRRCRCFGDPYRRRTGASFKHQLDVV
jgi:hypothetical protein